MARMTSILIDWLQAAEWLQAALWVVLVISGAGGGS